MAALAHGPAAQLLRVGVDRVQVAAITGDRFVADALLALPGRGRYRIAQLFHELASERTKPAAATALASSHGITPASVMAFADEFPYEPWWRL